MPTTWLALEFTDHRVRGAVAAVAKGTSTLTGLFELERGDPGPDGAPPAAAVNALRQALRSQRLRPARTVVILPKAQVTTRRVTLPSNDPAELATMAQFEAERHIPFHPERHIVSHHVVSNEGIEGAQVFLAAADEPVVAQALALAKAADLTVDEITVSCAASHAALLFSEPQAVEGRIVALVDIGGESTDISILRGGDLLNTRSVSGGVAALLAPAQEGGPRLPLSALGEMSVGVDQPDAGRAQVLAQFVTRIGGELRRTQEFTRREFNCGAPEEILVAGEGSIVEGLAAALGQSTGIPARAVSLTKLAARATRDTAHTPDLARNFVGIGALLEPVPAGAIRLNLAPATYRREREAQRLRQVAIVTAMLAVAVIVLALVHVKLSLSALRESANAHQSQVNELRPYVEEMDDKRTQLEIIRRFIDERNSAMAILDFLSGLATMPPRRHAEDDPAITTSLRTFKYDRERGTLELTGYVRDFNQIADFRAVLLSTGFFSGVTITDRRSTTLSQRAQPVTQFTFQCDLAQSGGTAAGRGRADGASAETVASPEALPRESAPPPGAETVHGGGAR